MRYLAILLVLCVSLSVNASTYSVDIIYNDEGDIDYLFDWYENVKVFCRRDNGFEQRYYDNGMDGSIDYSEAWDVDPETDRVLRYFTDPDADGVFNTMASYDDQERTTHYRADDNGDGIYEYSRVFYRNSDSYIAEVDVDGDLKYDNLILSPDNISVNPWAVEGVYYNLCPRSKYHICVDRRVIGYVEQQDECTVLRSNRGYIVASFCPSGSTVYAYSEDMVLEMVREYENYTYVEERYLECVFPWYTCFQPKGGKF